MPVQTPQLAVHQSMWTEVVLNPLLGKWIQLMSNLVCASIQQWTDFSSGCEIGGGGGHKIPQYQK